MWLTVGASRLRTKHCQARPLSHPPTAELAKMISDRKAAERAAAAAAAAAAIAAKPGLAAPAQPAVAKQPALPALAAPAPPVPPVPSDEDDPADDDDEYEDEVNYSVGGGNVSGDEDLPPGVAAKGAPKPKGKGVNRRRAQFGHGE